MSFFLTQDQIRKRQKIVTRRNGWAFIKPGDVINACVKCQGLKKGEKIEKICLIQVISTRWEKISEITENDVKLEGFPDWAPDQFIDMYCRFNKKKPDDMTNRIEFRYLYPQDHNFLFPKLCPYCKADMYYYADEWTHEADGTIKAFNIRGDCLAMPDFEKEKEWTEWFNVHSQYPYTYQMPIDEQVQRTLDKYVRFLPN